MSRLLFVSVLALLAAAARGQSLQVALPQPVAPGTFVPLIVTNDGASTLTWPTSRGIHLVSWGGDRVAPMPAAGGGGPTTTVAPGASVVRSVFVPASGPGSDGCLLVILTATDSATGATVRGFTRLDVQTGDADPATLHAHPPGVLEPFHGRGVPATATTVAWEIANTGDVPHVFAPGDTVALRSIATGATLLTMPLTGVVAPAKGAATVTLPIAGLPKSAWEVVTTFVEPADGQPRVFTYGLAPSARVSLHAPSGRVVPAGGALPLRLAMQDFPAFPPSYLVLLASAPGALTAANGAIVPASLSDPLLQLTASGGAGVIAQQFGFGMPEVGFPIYLGRSFAQGIALVHPGVAWSGFSFRAFGIALGFGTDLGASQSETFTLE